MCVSQPKSQLGVIASTYWLQLTWMYGTPRLDQSPGQQAALTERRLPIRFAGPLALARQVEGDAGLGRREQGIGALASRVPAREVGAVEPARRS